MDPSVPRGYLSPPAPRRPAPSRPGSGQAGPPPSHGPWRGPALQPGRAGTRNGATRAVQRPTSGTSDVPRIRHGSGTGSGGDASYVPGMRSAPGIAQAQATTTVRRRRGAPRSDPGGLVAGLVIAGIGLFFLAGQVEPDIGRFVVLFIGLALLAVFVLRREHGFLVPGSILTGVGIGVALTPVAVGEAGSGVMMLSIAGGFLGIWVLGSLYRSPQNHWWPLIPGGILTLIGLVQLSAADVGGALRLWPIALIVVGATVLARTVTSRA